MYTISANQHQWVENILLISSLICIAFAIFYFSIARNKQQNSLSLQFIGAALLLESGFFYAILHHWQISFVHHGMDYHAIGVPFNVSLFMIKWPILMSILSMSWLSCAHTSNKIKSLSVFLSFATLSPVWLNTNPTMTLLIGLILAITNFYFNWSFIIRYEEDHPLFMAWCWLSVSIISIPLFYLSLFTSGIHESLMPVFFTAISFLIIFPYTIFIFMSSQIDKSEILNE